jgi:hypothetical protein
MNKHQNPYRLDPPHPANFSQVDRVAGRVTTPDFSVFSFSGTIDNPNPGNIFGQLLGEDVGF